MSQNPDSGLSLDALRTRIDEIDTQIHKALMARAEAEALVGGMQESDGQTASLFHPERDADSMRQMVERHQGNLPLAVVEHIWRDIICACSDAQADTAIFLDGGAELIDMLDLARFYFGFSAELIPGSDAADVVGAVGSSDGDIGLVALADRAELPWWRGLSDAGALVRARLPFVVLEDRPADLPALVLSKADSLADNADVAVYDARWSDILPGRLMDQGIEVLSFFRSANGVDALLAISGELSEEDVMKACTAAGAEPDVLRCVGGYAAPIDGDNDPEDGFEAEEREPQE
ncbi:MAG: chorismate mutase [Roseibium sp.]|uniref:chorismate mutase n=1 Tax=Roseibium sp. TaxID=1936156 RepID=UPI002613205D|nr:chorismate mutase [Roseibium sp.]MCV0427998.1 chorismate mutase [Roseibium sp.]